VEHPEGRRPVSWVKRAKKRGAKQASNPNGRAQAPTVFRNFRFVSTEDGKGQRHGLSIKSIGKELGDLAHDWPRQVYGRLFVEGVDHAPLWLDSSDDLFAWIARLLPPADSNPLEWAEGAGKVGRGEFVAYLKQTVRRYEALETLPHHPLRSATYYLHPELKGGDGKALAQLLGRFAPATDEDRELMRAFVLTLFWGGPPGQRPAFLFDSDQEDEGGGRGVGKSTAAQVLARVAGGHIDVRANEDIDKIMTRLLSPTALQTRVALLDNVKTLRFSWADLEALITTDVISGRQLYVGEGRRPNTLTWLITLNGASLSKDMAQRTVVIRMRRPSADPAWRSETEAFIEAHRWQIVGDVVAELARTTTPLKSYSRWAAWEREVLAHVGGANACQQLIVSRQGEVDDDAAEADVVRDFFVAELERRGHKPEQESVWLSSAEAAAWVQNATGEFRPPNKATNYLANLRIAELRKSKRDDFGGRGWCWHGKGAGPDVSTVEVNAAASTAPF
jgi:hypothetical protein